MSANPDVLYEKLKALPPQRRAEVEDFMDFLKARDEKTRAQKTDELFSMMDRLSAVEPHLTPEEIQSEIKASRAQSTKNADRR